MSNRATADEFDATVRRTLDDVAAAARPDPALAERLIANARAGRTSVVSLDARRRAHRWMLPMLAAAAIAIVAVVATLASTSLSANGSHGPAHQPTPVHKPTPVHTTPVHKPTPVHTTPVAPPPAPPVVPHFRASGLYFTDAQHGWALGDGQCASGTATDCPALIATADGGQSWRRLPVPEGLVSTFDSSSCGDNGGIAGPCVENVLFANASDGYLWGLHEVYWTSDGGQSWSRYVNPRTDWDGATQMVIVGGTVVRLAPLQQCSVPCPAAVETAPVGTADFKAVTAATKQIGGISSSFGVVGRDLYLFAGGTMQNNKSVGVLRSSDDGRTWQPVNPDPCGNRDLSFFASNDIVAHDGALIASCGSKVRVAAPGSTQFSTPRRFPRGGELYAVAAESADVITAADVSHAWYQPPIHTTFYRTTDGGQTWQRGATLPVRGNAFTFTSESVGYAAAANSSTLYVTHDGGLTWTPRSFAP